MRDFPQARAMLGPKRVPRRLAYRYYRLAKGRWKRKQFAAAREAIAAAVSARPWYLKYRYYDFRWRFGEGE